LKNKSPSEEPLYMEAVVIENNVKSSSSLVKLTLNQEKQTIPYARLSPRAFNPEKITTHEDMVKMPILNEAEIVNNIFVRFRRDEIYTYIGKIFQVKTPLIGPTLLCMNPYK
jgi:myosin heavy subunit